MVSTNSAVNPHESILRKHMAKKSVLRNFIHTHFPPELLNDIVIDSLQQETKAFDHDLPKESTVDFVYKAEWLDQQGYVYFVIVFRSADDDCLIAFRMEKFIHSVMDHDLKTSGLNKLPLVCAVVIDQGTSAFDELRIPSLCRNIH